jgi:putative transposase
MERCQFVQQKQGRERSLEEKANAYVYLDATQDPKGRWGASVRSIALLACVGVDEEGGMHLDAPGTCGSGPRGSALDGLRRPRGDQGGRQLSGVDWQRCVVYFERNVLAHVPASSTEEVDQDLPLLNCES